MAEQDTSKSNDAGSTSGGMKPTTGNPSGGTKQGSENPSGGNSPERTGNKS